MIRPSGPIERLPGASRAGELISLAQAHEQQRKHRVVDPIGVYRWLGMPAAAASTPYVRAHQSAVTVVSGRRLLACGRAADCSCAPWGYKEARDRQMALSMLPLDLQFRPSTWPSLAAIGPADGR